MPPLGRSSRRPANCITLLPEFLYLTVEDRLYRVPDRDYWAMEIWSNPAQTWKPYLGDKAFVILEGVPEPNPAHLAYVPHPLTPEDRSAATRKAWESRQRAAKADAPVYPSDQQFDTSGRPIPIKVQSIEEAVTAVLSGHVVELPDVKGAATLIDRLAKIALDAKARGETAPDYDLCRVTVPRTNLFCADQIRTKEYPQGIPRVDMPQFSGKPVPGSPASRGPLKPNGKIDGAPFFAQHLRELGIPFSPQPESMPAASLRATQRELVGSDVAQMMLDRSFKLENKPIFVSRDNYVIDGHHRWAAAVGRDAEDGKLGDTTLRVVRIDAPITEVLAIAKKWSQDFGIAQKAAKPDSRRRAPNGP